MVDTARMVRLRVKAGRTEGPYPKWTYDAETDCGYIKINDTWVCRQLDRSGSGYILDVDTVGRINGMEILSCNTFDPHVIGADDVGVGSYIGLDVIESLLQHAVEVRHNVIELDEHSLRKFNEALDAESVGNAAFAEAVSQAGLLYTLEPAAEPAYVMGKLAEGGWIILAMSEDEQGYIEIARCPHRVSAKEIIEALLATSEV